MVPRGCFPSVPGLLTPSGGRTRNSQVRGLGLIDLGSTPLRADWKYDRGDEKSAGDIKQICIAGKVFDSGGRRRLSEAVRLRFVTSTQPSLGTYIEWMEEMASNEDELVLTLAEMGEVLGGSPYPVPDDIAEISAPLRSVLEMKREAKKGWQDLGTALKRHSQVELLREKWRFPFTHHSNLLELEGPSDYSTTERLARRHQPAVGGDVLAILGLLEGLRGDDRLVAGHDIAFQHALVLAEQGQRGGSLDSSMEDRDENGIGVEVEALGDFPFIRETDIRDLNQILEKGKEYKTGEQPGEYARHSRFITREAHIIGQGTQRASVGDDNRLYKETTPPHLIANEMHELCSWLNSRSAITDRWGGLIATVAHAWLTSIHPFSDGNGRTARILANLVLAHGVWPPLVIKSSTDRPRYIDALDQSDEGVLFPLYELFMEVRQRKLSELESERQFAVPLFELKISKERERLFTTWLERYRLLVRELDGALRGGMHVRRESEPDLDDYLLCVQRKSAPKVWALRLFEFDGPAIGLLWLGYCSDAMARALDLEGADFSPSIFFDLDAGFVSRMSGNAEPKKKEWRSSCDATGGVLRIEEIQLPPTESWHSTPGKGRVAVRYFNNEEYVAGQRNRFRRGTELDVVESDLSTTVQTMASSIIELVKSVAAKDT